MVDSIDDEAAERRYNQARYFGFTADQLRLEVKLAELDVQREDTRMQLERIRRIVSELGALCGYLDTSNLSAHGVTDACRAVIRTAHPDFLSVKDIKERLEKDGFDLKRYENASASIYTIVGRLERDKYVERKQDGFRVLYRWRKWQRRPRFRSRKARAGNEGTVDDK
jgi:hypothetical protein